MKRSYLAVLIFIQIAASSAAQSTSKTAHYFDSGVTLTIGRVETASVIKGSTVDEKPGKGNKFVLVHMTFENQSSEKQDIYINNIRLLDSANNSYDPQFAMASGLFNVIIYGIPSIKANDTKRLKLVYPYPKKMKPEYILVNGKTVKLKDK
jgi:hypothetical protein